MAGKTRKDQKIVKGMTSAVLLSIAIHAALFLLAGMLVVFTVVKRKEVEFEPPKTVERPKMKLKKPKVKIKKTSRPKPTQRIVTKINSASMPDIQLPEMSDIGDGLAGGVGGFDMMPDLGGATLFGGTQSIGNDLVGTFYDFKRDRSGRDIPHSMREYTQAVKEFVQSGWKVSKLGRYYQSPKKLYTTHIMIPPVLSLVAPEAFGEPDTIGYLWMIHYKGQLVHKEGIKFRFWGSGDDMLVVRVNGETVLNGSVPVMMTGFAFAEGITPHWRTSSAKSYQYYMGAWPAVVGDWITLEPGVPLDMEVLIGEVPGGSFSAMLAVEVDGVEYERGRQNNPILPMFTTAVPTLDTIETIYGDLVPGEASITNGPVFCDYETDRETPVWEPVETEPPVFADAIKEAMRTWSFDGDHTIDARFVAVIGDKAVLTDEKGKQRKIPLDRLSGKDKTYVELAQPPRFNIDFSKKSSQRFFEESPLIPGNLPEHSDFVFSAKLKQTSAGEYRYELKVEFFAIGDEIDGDNYILFDRQESRFIPGSDNGRAHAFSGRTVPVREFTFLNNHRGSKYGGYLVVVTDERGRIIDYGTSNKWLLDILPVLRQLPVGKHFDKEGNRVLPPSPKPFYY